MTRNEENIKRAKFFPPSSAKPFPRTKDNHNANKSFQERGQENQFNYIGNRDGTFHQNGEKATHYPRVMANRYCF
jgi:hypothetical protein